MKSKINIFDSPIDKLDPEQLKELHKRVQNSSKHEPWLYHFIERFHNLANNYGFNKKIISKKCDNTETLNPLMKSYDSIPPSTLTEITNPESKNLRLPNVSNLIALSECFNVSIDYLVGKTKCKHPEYEKIQDATGLYDETIQALKLKKILLDKPTYTRRHGTLPLIENGELAVEKLPASDSIDEIRKCFGNPIYQYKTNGLSKEKSEDEIIKEINDIIEQFPDIFDIENERIFEYDNNSVIEQKISNFRAHSPNEQFFDALDKLITYKDGLIINLLANYLYTQDLIISSPFICSDSDLFLEGSENPFRNKYSTSSNVPNETLFLSSIQSELVKLHEELSMNL